MFEGKESEKLCLLMALFCSHIGHFLVKGFLELEAILEIL